MSSDPGMVSVHTRAHPHAIYYMLYTGFVGLSHRHCVDPDDIYEGFGTQTTGTSGTSYPSVERNSCYALLLQQGTWMGMLIGSGCFARMLGPIFITFIYTTYGTKWSFSLISVFQMIMFLWLLLLEKRFSSVINSHLKRIEDEKCNAIEVEMVPLSDPEKIPKS